MKPKNRSYSRHLSIVTAMVASLSFIWQASATDVTWDITPGTVGPGDSAITGGLGPWNTSAGNWTTDGGVNNIAWNNAANDTAVFSAPIAATATVTLDAGGITAGGLIYNTGTASVPYVVTAGTLTLAGTTPTISVATGVTGRLDSVIASATGLTKIGPGSLILQGGTASIYTADTTVNAGQLGVNFAVATTNLINPSSKLVMNGGALSVLARSNAVTSQTFNQTTLASSHSVLQLNKQTTSSSGTLVLTSITRNAGATVNLFTSGTGGTTRRIQSGSWTGDSSTIRDSGVAYATFHDQSSSSAAAVFTGDNWAAYNGTTAVALTGYTNSDGISLTGNANLVSDTILSANTSITTLRNNLAGARSINIGANTLTTGGILIGSLATTTIITGGTLESASTVAGKDLVIFTNNAGITSIGAIIANSAAGTTGLTKSGPGNLTLSGSNTYTGPTIINGGSLTSSVAAALGSSPSVLIGSGAALTVSYGGAGSYTNPEITSLLAKTTFADATSGFGFDTTDATGGTANFAGGYSASTGLAKSGVGTLVLTGANSHTGTTSVFGGTLKIADPGALGSTGLGSVISNGAAVALAGGITITGEALSLLGEGVSQTGALRSISGTNSWTSDITLAGTARVNADAGTLTLGGVGTSGTLLLSGNGNITVGGLVTGTAGVTVEDLLGDGTTSGTMTLSGVNTNTGTITVASGRLDLTGNRTAAAGVIVVGNTAAKTGTLNFSNGNFSTGANSITVGESATGFGVVVHTSGTLGTGANFILVGSAPGATGTYTLSGGTLTSGHNNVNAFILGANSGSTGTFNLSGSGTLNVDAGANATLQIGRSNSTTTASNGTFNQSGGIATIRKLAMGGGGINNDNTISQLNLTGGTFTVTGSFSALSAGDTSSSSILIGGTADVTLPAFPTTRGTGSTATITFDGGTLKPTAASAIYMSGLTEATIQAGGAKIDVATGKDILIAQDLLTHASSTGGGLTKAGLGALTLSGANTYTGATAVNEGTLALVGGSQKSAITVADGAFLGFTPGSGTSSTSTVTFGSTAKVRITGTPTLSSYTLMTTTGIAGTPVLETPISGYELVVEGNSLKLNSTAGYSSWQTANSTTQTINLDHDSDGVSNGVEYFLGGSANTTGFTTVPGVINNAGTLSITWVKSGAYTGTYGTDFLVETSSTLATGSWTTAATSGTPAVSNTVYINGNNVTYTFPAGTKNFARLRVTGP